MLCTGLPHKYKFTTFNTEEEKKRRIYIYLLAKHIGFYNSDTCTDVDSPGTSTVEFATLIYT